MKIINKNKLAVALTLLACAPFVGAMQALDETQLGDVSGEGMGTVFENMVIDSADYHQDINLAFKVKVKLTNDPIPQGGIDPNDYIILSELRFHCSVNETNCRNDQGITQGGRGVGGFFGTYDDPYMLNQITDLTDYAGKVRTALVTGWPGGGLKQEERSFFNYTARNWNGKLWGSSAIGVAQVGGIGANNSTLDSRGMPRGFFSNQASVGMGQFYAQADSFQQKLDDFDASLDQIANKFDMHFRVDAITDANRDKGIEDQFLSYVDAIGARLYGTTNTLWSHNGQGNGPNRGLAMSMTIGLKADELRLTTSLDGGVGSQLSMKGVDIYLPQGSVNQPMTISTVQYAQTKRGTWKNPVVLSPTTQMRIEIAGITAAQVAAETPAQLKARQGHIFIQSMAFGDPNDPDIITGVENIYLRDASGNIVKTVENVKHRAFVPKTVIYNEQVDNYNNSNPNANIPNIPNQNVIEIRGLEIQRMVMTTQDLHR